MSELIAWRIFAWCSTVAWFTANLTYLSLPLQGFDFLIFGLVLNAAVGGVTLVVWSRYNKFRAEAEALQEKDRLARENEAKKRFDEIGYVQDVIVSQDTFDKISRRNEAEWIDFDSEYASTIMKGKRIHIHNEVNYGTVVRAEILEVDKTSSVSATIRVL